MREHLHCTYEKIERPKNKKCPDGLELCPGAQSAQNQICVKSNLTDCPINYLKIEKPGYVSSSDEQMSYYTDQYVIISSKEKDARPLTEFKIAFQPCIIESQNGCPQYKIDG